MPKSKTKEKTARSIMEKGYTQLGEKLIEVCEAPDDLLEHASTEFGLLLREKLQEAYELGIRDAKGGKK